MVKSKFFTAARIDDRTTLITGLGGENCYLLEGDERALLIDGLTGVGSLKAFVRELTDLPITMLATHGHVDHCGAAFEYGACLIHPDDIALMYEHGDEQLRFGAVPHEANGARFDINDVIPLRPVRTLPLYDGDVVDLGGRFIEAITVTGHTRGTVVLLDRDMRALFSGDACNNNTLVLGGISSATVEEYHASLKRLATFIPAFDKMLGGHGSEPVPPEIINEGIELTRKVIDRTDEKIAGEFIGIKCLYGAKAEMYKRTDGKIFNIAYTEENIFL